MWPAAPWDPSVRAMCGIDSSTWKCVARPLSPSTCRKGRARAGQPPPLRERGRLLRAGAGLLPATEDPGHRPFPPGAPRCTRDGAAAGRAGRTGQPQQGRWPTTPSSRSLDVVRLRWAPTAGAHAPGRGRAGRTRPSSRASSGAGRRPSPPRPPPPRASGAGPAPRPSASGSLPSWSRPRCVLGFPQRGSPLMGHGWGVSMSHLSPRTRGGTRCVGDTGGDRVGTRAPGVPDGGYNGEILVFLDFFRLKP